MIKAILPERGTDHYGSGAWGASRGTRTHKGIDYVAPVGAIILSPIVGEVTKHGRPYADDDTLKYIELTDDEDYQWRFFYVLPLIGVGEQVFFGDSIGTVQDLTVRYSEGMTNHCHFELKRGGHHLGEHEFKTVAGII